MTDLPLCNRTTSENSKLFFDFGFADKRGRKIGACIHRFMTTFAPVEADSWGGYRHEPGTFFSFIGKATRNGEGYGASQPMHHFKTEAERDAAIETYLTSARKRAATPK